MLMTFIGLAIMCIGFAFLLVGAVIHHVEKLNQFNELKRPDLTNSTEYTGPIYNRHGRELG